MNCVEWYGFKPVLHPVNLVPGFTASIERKLAQVIQRVATEGNRLHGVII